MICEKFDQLLDHIDDVIEWVENGVESLAADDGLLADNSALARWTPNSLLIILLRIIGNLELSLPL